MTKTQTAKDDSGHRRVLVIQNPAAGGSRTRCAATLDRLRAFGCDLEIRSTARRGDAQAFARAAPGQGFDRVVAAGGDGTINEVVNGLAGTGVPLALIPLGTANVLAAEIGVKPDPGVLAETILRGEPRSVCLGRVREASGAARFFVAMAGVGVDAHAVEGVHSGLKRVLGKGAYYAEILRQLLIFPFPRYRLSVDGIARDAASVVIAKGRYYAGRYVLAPEARLTEPVFHVCLFERGGRTAALSYACAMQRGRLADQPGYRIVTGRKVRIEGPMGDPVQSDGDIVARLPVEIDAVPDALRLVMPVSS